MEEEKSKIAPTGQSRDEDAIEVVPDEVTNPQGECPIEKNTKEKPPLGRFRTVGPQGILSRVFNAPKKTKTVIDDEKPTTSQNAAAALLAATAAATRNAPQEESDTSSSPEPQEPSEPSALLRGIQSIVSKFDNRRQHDINIVPQPRNSRLNDANNNSSLSPANSATSSLARDSVTLRREQLARGSRPPRKRCIRHWLLCLSKQFSSGSSDSKESVPGEHASSSGDDQFLSNDDASREDSADPNDAQSLNEEGAVGGTEDLREDSTKPSDNEEGAVGGTSDNANPNDEHNLNEEEDLGGTAIKRQRRRTNE